MLGKSVLNRIQNAKRFVFRAKKIAYANDQLDYLSGSTREWVFGRAHLSDIRNECHVFLTLNLRRVQPVSLGAFRRKLSLYPKHTWLNFAIENWVGLHWTN